MLNGQRPVTVLLKHCDRIDLKYDAPFLGEICLQSTAEASNSVNVNHL